MAVSLPESLNDFKICTHCNERFSERLLFPCFHYGFCKVCQPQSPHHTEIDQEITCPTCRKDVYLVAVEVIAHLGNILTSDTSTSMYCLPSNMDVSLPENIKHLKICTHCNERFSERLLTPCLHYSFCKVCLPQFLHHRNLGQEITCCPICLKDGLLVPVELIAHFGNIMKSRREDTSMCFTRPITGHLTCEASGERNDSVKECPPNLFQLLLSNKVALDKYRQTALKILDEAKSSVRAIEESIQINQNMGDNIEIKFQNVATEIRNTICRYMAVLEARQRDLLCQLENIRQVKRQSLLLHTEDLKSHLNELSQMIQYIQYVVAHEREFDVLKVQQMCMLEMNKIKQRHGSIQQRVDDNIVFSQPDNGLLSAIGTLGFISTSRFDSVAAREGLPRYPNPRNM